MCKNSNIAINHVFFHSIGPEEHVLTRDLRSSVQIPSEGPGESKWLIPFHTIYTQKCKRCIRLGNIITSCI